MPKHLTPNQILGEIGENAVRGRFLSMGSSSTAAQDSRLASTGLPR